METSGIGPGRTKRRIEIEVALHDIRSGMDDASLMHKYRVSARGLQSLFNKLVRAGEIELAELDQRMPAFMGTVFLSDDLPAGQRIPSENAPAIATLTGPSIDLDQALLDIREGMEDPELMVKYRLSAQGLESLFDHLVYTELITRAELDLRMPLVDSTVDLRSRVGTSPQGKETASSSELGATNRETPLQCRTAEDGHEKVDCAETASKFADKLWPQG